MTNKNSNSNNGRESRKDYRQSLPKPLWRRILKWTFLGVFLILVAGVGLFAFYAKDAPNISRADLESGGSSGLYNTNGKFIMSLGTEKRLYVKDSKDLQLLKDAIVSVEDKRFYRDKLGIDPIRIAGSMLTNAKSKSISAGGSTITQQLVKLTKFSTSASQRTLRRKAQEAWLAMRVQREYSHDEILEFYINKVYMNYGNTGIGTAANFYYGKKIGDLDLAQTAMLAGMPNRPTVYNPYTYPEYAKYRRNIVLKAMLNNKKISQEQYDEARKESIKKGLKPHNQRKQSNLRKINDPYIKEAIAEVRAKGFDPFRDNLKITINMDQKAQKKLYQLANNGQVPFTNDKMQIGASVVDPSNGHVVAILGGRHLPSSVQLGLDRAVQTTRSTGSSIKPVLDYGPAIEYLNWSTAKMLDDSKYVYPGTNVQLYDWDNKYDGMMTMRHALEQSRNVPAVKTLREVGVKRAAKFAGKMDINVPKDSGLSVAIGANASSLQMAGAFSAFATMGIYHKPQFVSKIETPDGLTRNYDSEGIRVMSKSTAYMITDMLKGVIKRGSGTNAQIRGLHHAGKTGSVKYSEQDLARYPAYAATPKDSWFVGYTPSYSIGVWTGYDNLKDGTISGIGQQSAQLFYKNMMTYLMRNKENVDWQKPDSVIRAKIARNSNPPEVSSTGEWQLFVRGHSPIGIVDDSSDYDEDDEKTNTNDSSSTNTQGRYSVQHNQNGSTRQPDKNQRKAKSSKDKKQNHTSENDSPNSSQNNDSNNSDSGTSSDHEQKPNKPGGESNNTNTNNENNDH
ncbi:transglycosylase domain-containing protein [Lactobacillus kullabergensis]|uniref:transglycosylase domain-containing protein n=1 Tax=Lactobacillus TaxID=1578 RepID=UPI0018DE72E1|nr:MULTISPECIES: transglycosylase domain-containing protein [Lactobacillus]MBI0120310.1 transglycosylase domain-containing protein [Lactobacillus sp. M0398]MBI0122458.1 transglycosylase domain-containing protein [Lactobacillus sp. W8174]MBI0134478.1 transglycosylase domain-containing protein [Lactobacillus sp. W8173]MCX0290519.1 transglycosylase domain-containing protein [Lactobacillus kullabergensis]